MIFAPASAADRHAATEFVGRVAQLDPAAVVHLVGSATDSGVDLWAKGGFGVLATRRVAGHVQPDPLTVYATNLVAALAVSRDSAVDPGSGVAEGWRTQLPPAAGWIDAGHLTVAEIDEQVTAAKEVAERAVEIERVGELRAKTKATVPPVVLDQVLLSAGRVPVSMRMLFALSGMGFADASATRQTVAVRVTTTWLRLDTPQGSVARRRMADLPLLKDHTRQDNPVPDRLP